MVQGTVSWVVRSRDLF